MLKFWIHINKNGDVARLVSIFRFPFSVYLKAFSLNPLPLKARSFM
jgi:hypothetical protein